jgi:hypothetical protein
MRSQNWPAPVQLPLHWTSEISDLRFPFSELSGSAPGLRSWGGAVWELAVLRSQITDLRSEISELISQI